MNDQRPLRVVAAPAPLLTASVPEGVKRSAEGDHQFALGYLRREFCKVVETKGLAGVLVLNEA
jgi:hypothetical protein